MLLIILIGAALDHVRPEPPSSIALPTNPQCAHRKRWRCTAGGHRVLALNDPAKNLAT
ncbi:hypothetical protein [Pseudomonas sp. A34-9]|uniref:hypothetical protein n=1 Tax=Pseudomonas sp. A34-9 TaxID=3034675 RepID=UPI00240E31DA|nr:hypothetical protein [Pseudomonas sp. A34-9]